MAYIGSSPGYRRRAQRAVPLLLGLVGSICSWAPFAQAELAIAPVAPTSAVAMPAPTRLASASPRFTTPTSTSP